MIRLDDPLAGERVSDAYEEHLAALIEEEYARSLEEQERDFRREQLLATLRARVGAR